MILCSERQNPIELSLRRPPVPKRDVRAGTLVRSVIQFTKLGA